MLLVPIPWTVRVRNLPLSAHRPFRALRRKAGQAHEKLANLAWQLLLSAKHRYPLREIPALTESTYLRTA